MSRRPINSGATLGDIIPNETRELLSKIDVPATWRDPIWKETDRDGKCVQFHIKEMTDEHLLRALQTARSRQKSHQNEVGFHKRTVKLFALKEEQITQELLQREALITSDEA